jgi:hypothetical protein
VLLILGLKALDDLSRVACTADWRSYS